MMDLFQNPSSLKSNNFQTAMWASKLVLMSIGVISILVLLKVAIIPYTFHLLLSTLPSLWASARSWLSLPFIYIIVNFIIIIIAVSSNFHHKSTPFSEVSTHQTEPESQRNEPKEEAKEFEKEEEEQVKEEVKDFGLPFNKFIIESSLEKSKSNNKPKEGAREIEKEREEVKDFGLSFNKFITHKTSFQKSKRNVPKEEEAKEIEQEREEVKEFGLSFNKFITHKTSPLEKCTNDYFLLDYDDDDDDSMEATWRAIMEGQGKKMKPQLKKSDTWGARITKAEPLNDSEVDDHVAWAQRELKKSETFNDRVSLRRDKSMSPEELNRRAEDFIKKFNNQMKLQRLESHQRYLDMVNGSV